MSVSNQETTDATTEPIGLATVTPTVSRRRGASDAGPSVARANPLTTMMRNASNSYRSRMIPVPDGFDPLKMLTTDYLVKLAMYGLIPLASTALDDIFKRPFKWKKSESKSRVKKSFDYLKDCVTSLGMCWSEYSNLSKSVQTAKNDGRYEDVRGLKVRLEALAVKMVDHTVDCYLAEYKKTVVYNSSANKPLMESNARKAFQTLGFSTRTDKLVSLDRMPGSEGSVILQDGRVGQAAQQDG